MCLIDRAPRQQLPEELVVERALMGMPEFLLKMPVETEIGYGLLREADGGLLFWQMAEMRVGANEVEVKCSDDDIVLLSIKFPSSGRPWWLEDLESFMEKVTQDITTHRVTDFGRHWNVIDRGQVNKFDDRRTVALLWMEKAKEAKK